MQLNTGITTARYSDEHSEFEKKGSIVDGLIEKAIDQKNFFKLWPIKDQQKLFFETLNSYNGL